VETSRDGGVFESHLCSAGEYVAGRQDRRWGDGCFNHVGTIEAWLVIGSAIGQGEGEEALLCDTVIVGGWGTIECDQDGDGVDILNVNKAADGACDAQVRVAVDHLGTQPKLPVDGDGRMHVRVDSADAGGAHDVGNTVGEGVRGFQ
jgi:hypothetical protein